MTALLRLELAKLVARRSVLYLLLPNLYTVLYSLALTLAAVSGSQKWMGFLGSVVTASLALHPWVSISAYPMCMLMLCSDLWGTEATDRTLRTLVLMQVPRGRLLAARVITVAGVIFFAFAIYFGLFFAHTVVLSHLVAPEVWAKISFPIESAFANTLVFAAAFAVGVVTLTLWVTLMALVASRTSTVGMLTVMTLAALAFGVPTVEEWLRPGSHWSQLLFTQQYLELTGKELLKGLMREQHPWGAELARVTGVLALNALVLYPLCWTVLRRRQFVD